MPESKLVRILCAKEVGQMLEVSERTAQRLMASGAIKSFRAGEKLLRTTDAHVNAYKERACEPYRRAPWCNSEAA